MADDAIVEHHLDTAEDFLAALRPGSAFWKGDPGPWVFRGHADSNWLLVPSENRRASLAPYFGLKYQGEGAYCLPEAADLGAVMVEFVHALDRAGYHVPGVGRFTIEEIAEKVKSGRPDAHTHELVALAQHQGLPTYMLDWTQHGTTAAYFAASDTAHVKGDETGDIEVWALNTSIAPDRSQSTYGFLHGYAASFHVSSPLRAGNTNLQAQGGVFTFTTHLNVTGELQPIDAIVRAMGEENPRWVRPVMHRFRLPLREAGRVLWLLAFEPVSAGTLFPGLGGVVRDVRDRRRSSLRKR